ncbi:type I polyketide synthase [Mycolicibacterium litorale]|nr:type I polyketide synthase [Mycolicibacterium litorale]MCV7413700.1 acyltransferase domain-containing protein [Mycolicibacterium litorale]
MAARLPGADSVSAFWDNLRRGEESIVTLTDQQLLAAGVTEQTLGNPAYVRRAPLITGIDEFDADFFGFPPQMARMMDPQHRLFLQCAWHAMEDAGTDPAGFDGSIGVYATSGASIYLLHNLLTHHDPDTIFGQGATFDLVNMSLLNDKDYLATRVSHQFNLRGPSLTVQTACSSSMVAIHSACQSLLNGESDMALAGGVSLRVPHEVGYWHEPGSMVSGTGHCRPFDAKADGTVFGSGVAVVVLKPLQAALDDGDRIHAVIRGSAINNDGSAKMTYAAPNGAAQADVIAEAHAVAGVDAASISYVETHGTGTPLGDPIEIEGLRKAFGASDTPRTGPCAVGSVKSNIGHLAEVSGIAGLIKTILCLKHKAIPATLHYTEPNPALDLDRGPFVIQNEYTEWECDGVRRAGVSSFGVGGTNVHLVVEEAPAPSPREMTGGTQVLRFAARSPEAVGEFRSALAAELTGAEELDLADVAATLAGRRPERIRAAAVVHDRQDAAAVLLAPDSDNVFVGEFVDGSEADEDRVVFLFPGQGAQHPEMARGLYDSEPVFAAAFDECAAGFSADLGVNLHDEIFGAAGADLERTDRAQSALFTVEYALGRLITSYGVEAAAYAGHSIGEYAAATLAGVFDLPTAIRVVSARARLMHGSAPGAMVAVGVSPEDIAPHLFPGLDLAAVNDPGSCVVSGAPEDIRKFQNDLRKQGVVARRVRTSHAFHSGLMDPVVPQFAEVLAGVTLHAPRIPLLSNVSGTWMTDDEATDPAVWARQIRATVRFADELAAVLSHPRRVLVEVGPGGTLTGSAVRHPQWSDGHRAVRLMRHQVQKRDDRDAFLLALGQLWTAGVDVDWSALEGDRTRRVTLPGYPFARQKHWVEPDHDVPRARAGADGSMPATGDAAGEKVAAHNGHTVEEKLQQVWRECLGVPRIDPDQNFFEIGGDSLIAIGIAMNATNQGLELTPQDLYEHPTVSALAAAVTARSAAGGLTELPPTESVDPPVPPNIIHFLEHGVRDAGHWRVPLLLRINADVGVDTVQAVLTAVTNHHDALRVQIVERCGSWEQRFSGPVEAVDLTSLSLPPGTSRGSVEEREAVLAALEAQTSVPDLDGPVLRTAYIRDAEGNPCYLAITVHEMIVDGPSREILLTDIVTAFGQHLAGQQIALSPVTTTWRDWSQRAAALTTHPAVLASRDYWLENATRTTMHLADHHVTDPPRTGDFVRIESTLRPDQTEDLDRVRRLFQSSVEGILLGALSRTVAHLHGEGVVAVTMAGDGRSVLKPDVDARRAVGPFTTLFPFPLPCVSSSAAQVLEDIHSALDAVPHHGIGHGLLRYLYGPTVRAFAPIPTPDMFLSNEGVVPDLASGDGPVQFDIDAAKSLRDKPPGLGHAIELRICRSSSGVHLDWWHDIRRVPPATVAALAEHLPEALSELLGEALSASDADADMNGVVKDFGLVDLTAD